MLITFLWLMKLHDWEILQVVFRIIMQIAQSWTALDSGSRYDFPGVDHEGRQTCRLSCKLLMLIPYRKRKLFKIQLVFPLQLAQYSMNITVLSKPHLLETLVEWFRAATNML